MNLEAYLQTTLPSGGNYYVAWETKTGRFQQSNPLKTKAQVAAAIRAHDAKGEDVWVATGSFGKSRQATDVVEKRAFYADLDAGEGKPYPTKKAIFHALKAALGTGTLPAPTMVVDSGNGLHLYWALRQGIPAPKWLLLAKRLEQSLATSGLEVDPVVTCDAARVLRPPETSNHKDRENAKPCTVAAHFSSRVYSAESFSAALPEGTASSVKLAASDGKLTSNGSQLAAMAPASDLESGIDMGWFDNYPESDRLYHAQTMLDKLTDAKWYEYETWLKIGAALKQASTLNNTDAAWLQLWDEWSQKGPGYKEQDLLKKWTSGKMRSITVGTLIKFAQDSGWIRTDPSVKFPYPVGYAATPYGTVRLALDKDDTDRTVFQAHLLGMEMSYDPDVGNIYRIKMRNLETHTPHVLVINDIQLNSPRDGIAQLGRAGIVMAYPRNTFPEVVLLMQAFRQQLVTAPTDISSAVKHFGWIEDHGQHGFSTGGHTFMADGTTRMCAVTDQVMKQVYTPHGDLAKWREVVQHIIDQGRQEINATIATAFAAPLILLTGTTGAVVSLTSRDSGTGKSTALQAAQSVWGKPQAGINALDDTVNSVTKRLETLNSLPAFWDELRMKAQTLDFIKLLFALSQGKGKSRLTANSEMAKVGTWNTLITVAGNEPLAGHIDQLISSTDAGMFRLFEFEAQHLPKASNVGDAMRRLRIMNSNYGLAGEVYARWLAEHREDAAKMVATAMTSLSNKWKVTPAERFWLAVVTTIYVGAAIATKANIVRFDLPKLLEFLKTTFAAHRKAAGKQTREVNVLDLLEHYLAEMRTRSIQTDTINFPGRRGRPKALLLRWPLRPELVHPPLVYQHGEDNSMLIDERPFFDWVYRTHNLAKQTVLPDLLKLGVRRLGRGKLGSGTPFAAVASAKLLYLDMADSRLAVLFDN